MGIFTKRLTWKKLRFNLGESLNTTIEKPLLTSLVVLIVVTIVVGGLSLPYYINDFDLFWPQILAEAHGMIFDIAIIGILLFWLNQNGETRQRIRSYAENVTKFYTVFVVDEQDRLLGKVALQDIVISDANKLVADIYEQDVVSVETYLPDTEVAGIMKKYDLESVPVVNVKGQLVGRITIDDVVDVITEQAEEDRQLMTGITEDVEEDDTVWKNTRARLPWLLIGIFGGMLSARFMGMFELELARVTAIAFFVPLIQATGGNVGIQSSSLVVQSLASTGYVDEGLWQRMTKVLFVALLNGFFLSVLVFGANWLLFGNHELSVAVSIALFAVVVFASLIGTITPLILDRFGFNPAVASGPFITTINDLLGLTVYFFTIHVML